MIGTVRKRPSDQLDYDIDFGRWLSEGDAIQGASASVEPIGVSVDSVQAFGVIVKVWLSGGVSGSSQRVSVMVTTAQGRTKEVSFNLRVAEC